MKKRFLLMLAAILVIATVTGCGGNDAPKAEEAEESADEEASEIAEEAEEKAPQEEKPGEDL